MHVLVLTDGLPYPLTSGRLRQYHLVRQLACRHRISLLSTVPPGHSLMHVAALSDAVDWISTVPSRRLAPAAGPRAVGVLEESIGGASPVAREVSRRISQRHAEARIDVVLNARLPLPLGEVLPGVPVVADICDTVSAGLRRRLSLVPWHQRPWTRLKLAETRMIERRILPQSDALLFASARDRSAMSSYGPLPPSTVLPNGVDLDYWRRRTAVRAPNSVVFAGAMPYAPNDDAARFLLRDVLPLLRRVRPDVRVVIAGRDPGHALSTAAAARGVELTGAVDDLRPYLEAATVALAPLRFGSGIQNKILEAMAMELPVVTTPLAYAGMTTDDAIPGVVVAEDARGLARATLQALQSADEDPAPCAVARRWVSTRFVWDDMGRRLEQVLDEAVARGPRLDRPAR